MAGRAVFVHEPIDPTGASLRWLESRGVRVTEGHPMWEHPQRFLSESELIERAAGHQALMGSGAHHVTRPVIESLPELRFVSLYGIGLDAVDVAAATEHGVLVTNTPAEENWRGVAETTVAMLLALLKRLPFYDTAYRRGGGWRNDRAWPAYVTGRTIGIVGFGRIGREVARRLSGWDVRIVAHDPAVGDAPSGVTMVDLATLLAEADAVTLHAPAVPANHHLIDAAAVAAMKPGAVLVNTSRGMLVDLDAAAEALAAGHLGGVAVDAYEVEPPPVEHPLFALANVIATPHLAGWTVDTCVAMGRMGAENLWSLFEGRRPENLVNPEAADRER